MNAASTALATGPFVQYVAVAAVGLATWSRKAAFLVLVMLASDLANPLLKKVAAALLPAWLTDRPSGCGSADGPPVSCDVFPRVGVCSDSKGTGFPSGHCQSMAVTAAFVTRWALRSEALTPLRRAVTVGAAWAAALAVLVQRVAVRCHSVPQALAGMLVGVVVGWSASAAADRLVR